MLSHRPSKLTSKEEITKSSYDSTAVEWSKTHWTPKFWGDNFDYFYRLLPKGRVLEVGCGGGRDAQELIKFGYEYTGTDISENLIDQARKNNPGAKFKVVNIYDLNFKEQFDGFWCAAMLIHIPRERINEALIALRRNIKPGGIGFISIKKGRDDLLEKRSDLSGKKFYFVFWDNDDFKKTLRLNGFEVLREGYMPMSHRSKWLTYHVRAK